MKSIQNKLSVGVKGLAGHKFYPSILNYDYRGAEKLLGRSIVDIFWLSRSSWAIYVIALSRLSLLSKKQIVVWIPDYFCDYSLIPLRKLNVIIIYYPITKALIPEEGEFKRIACTSKPDIILVTHYFQVMGIPEWVKSFSYENSAWLIEDAAHIADPISLNSLKTFGDFILFSPHKHYEIPDGAIMVVSKDGPSDLNADSDAMKTIVNEYQQLINSSGSNFYANIVWFLKLILKKIGFKREFLVTDFNTSIRDNRPYLHPRISTISKILLHKKNISRRFLYSSRKEKINAWMASLQWLLIGKDPYKFDYAESVESTYMLRLICKEPIESIKIFDLLQTNKIRAHTWPDLPAEVLENQLRHKDAISKRQRSIFLSLDENFTLKAINEFGLKNIKVLISNWAIKRLSVEEWDFLWMQSNEPNLIQSRQYGLAITNYESLDVIHLAVIDHQAKPISLVQILLKKFGGIFSIVRINRGPIVLSEFDETENSMIKTATLQMILDYAKENYWTLLLLAPNLILNTNNLKHMNSLGLIKRKSVPWGSGLIPLHLSEQEILMSLDGKWRNCLRKAQKNKLIIKKLELTNLTISNLLSEYKRFFKLRNFKGLNLNLLANLAKIPSSPAWEFSLFACYLDSCIDEKSKNHIGILVTIRSGNIATYLIGMTNELGRNMNVNYFMLWESIINAKKNGCNFFDIGGLNLETLPGIASFKKGMNSKEYGLIGEYIWSSNNMLQRLLKAFFKA